MPSPKSMTGRAPEALADALSPDALHQILDRYAAPCCPVVLDVFPHAYHWSLRQVEYSTDLVFCSQATLKPLYEQLARQAVLSVKAEHVATFLGRKITPAARPRDRQPVHHPHRGNLHQASLWQRDDQDVRQIRPRAAPGDHQQRCLRLQAPPQSGTSQGPGQPRPRPGQEDHLQPQRPAFNIAGLRRADLAPVLASLSPQPSPAGSSASVSSASSNAPHPHRPSRHRRRLLPHPIRHHPCPRMTSFCSQIVASRLVRD
jgi:hypothetical protein